MPRFEKRKFSGFPHLNSLELKEVQTFIIYVQQIHSQSENLKKKNQINQSHEFSFNIFYFTIAITLLELIWKISPQKFRETDLFYFTNFFWTGIF